MSLVEKFVSMEYGPAPEDPREAVVWLERHGRRLGHFIGGAWVAPVDGQYFDTTDPSSGEVLASVAQGSAADVDAAVGAARGALYAWQSLPNPWRGLAATSPSPTRGWRRSRSAPARQRRPWRTAAAAWPPVRRCTPKTPRTFSNLKFDSPLE